MAKRSSPRKDLESELDPPNLERWLGGAVTAVGAFLLAGGAGGAAVVAGGGGGATLELPAWAPLAAAGGAGLTLVLVGATLARLAVKTRHQSLVFEGLTEEISQEFDKVNHRQDLLADALTATDTRVSRLKDAFRRAEREAERDGTRPAMTVRVEK